MGFLQVSLTDGKSCKTVCRQPGSLCLEDLPCEVITIILSELSVHDLMQVALTCKKLRDAVLLDNLVWTRKSANTFIVRSHKSLQNQRNANNRSSYHLYRVSTNWRKGFFRDMIIAETPVKYMPWMTLHPSWLLHSTGYVLKCYARDRKGIPHSRDITWKLYVPRVERHSVRTNDISRFVAKDDTIVCGNRDGCVAIYSVPDSHPCRPKLTAHILDCHKAGNVEVSAVECMRAADNLCIISASVDDNQLKIWRRAGALQDENLSDKKSFQCTRVVSSRIQGVRSMRLNEAEDTLAAGLKSNTRPLLVDIETGKMINSPEGYFNNQEHVRDLVWLNENLVVYVRHTALLSAYDIRTGQVVYNRRDPLCTSLYSVACDGHRAVVTGCAQLSRCVLYDIRSPLFVQTYFSQNCPSPVYSVAFDAKMLAAAAERGVGLLNFDVNAGNTRQRDFGSSVRNFR